MKIICSKNNLLKSVNISLKAVPSKTTMPIYWTVFLSNVSAWLSAKIPYSKAFAAGFYAKAAFP